MPKKSDFDFIEQIAFLEKLIESYPEWLVYGTWDTPRCIVCKGFQYKRGSAKPGHKAGCLREKFNHRKTMKVHQDIMEV